MNIILTVTLFGICIIAVLISFCLIMRKTKINKISEKIIFNFVKNDYFYAVEDVIKWHKDNENIKIKRRSKI